MRLKLTFSLALSLLWLGSHAQQMESATWTVGYDDKGLTSITSKLDPYGANLINTELGDVLVNYKVKDGLWARISSANRKTEWNPATRTLTYTDEGMNGYVVLTQRFNLVGDRLHWAIELENRSKFPVEIGDLAPHIPWTNNGRDQKGIFERAFTKHASISGDGSFLYFTRLGGMAPYYLLTVDKGTKLEYFANVASPGQGQGQGGGSRYRVFIHSGHTNTWTGHSGHETRGTWRQPFTEGWLQPSGQAGSKMTYGMSFHVADSYEGLRDKVYEAGLIDIRTVPGLAIPTNQKGRFALRTKCDIDSIGVEFPRTTKVTYLGETAPDTHIYEVSFSKLGENLVTIYFDGGRKTYLEYFSSESPETMMKKRASFLVNSQQFRDPSKWYDGLYGVYDMMHGELRGPDNPDFFDEFLTYFLASDDPILGKAPYLASKNVVFPDDDEIASLEYHMEHFVWGGLQRTDKETPYEYGIYGTPNWYINRHQDLRETQTNYKLETIRTWRTYDYAHMVMFHWHMYQIAKMYPDKVKFMDADQYLEIAFQTAKAYYIYPVELLGEYYEPFKWGCYNELVIVDLIDELDRLGQKDKADVLRAGWEKKAKYFIYDDEYPYRSEYAIDRTAFESSYALAKYAVQNDMKPDQNLWYDRNEEKWYSHPVVTRAEARKFMDHQHFANLSCRGVLENQWSIQGGDFARSSDGSTHSYMARMGGWGVLDYGYRFAEDPYEWLAVGYASYLNPYGLMNTGTAESNYGYWYPGKDKDGALGQAFTNVKFGRPWIQTDEARGPWRYCGEGDLGMCAITRTAATMLVDDPTFGWIVYGGNMEHSGGSFRVVPDDGARIRFRVISDERRVGIELNRDNLSATAPVVVNANMREMEINLESATTAAHTTQLTVELMDATNPRLTAGGRNISSKRDKYGNYVFNIPVSAANTTLKLQWR